MPAPATPPPAPTQTATPTPTPAPAPSAPSTPAPDPSSDYDSKMEGLLGVEPAAPKPAASPEPPKADATKKPEPAKPAAAPAPAKPEPKPEPAKPAAQGGPKELREELERTRTELKTHKETSAQLEAKIKSYEAQGRDAEALKARLEQRDKEYEAMQSELRALKREASPEFKKQYQEPFDRAANYAAQIVSRLVKPDGTKADFDHDFVRVYQAAKSNIGAAYGMAREIFGEEQAGVVMNQVHELDRLDAVRATAFEDEKKNWAEREKQEEGKRVQQQAQMRELGQKVFNELRDANEDFRDPVDDKEMAEARQAGYALFHNNQESIQDKMVRHATIQHRAAAFEPLKLMVSRLRAENDQLMAQLEETRVRQPGEEPSKPGGAPVVQPEKGFDEDFGDFVKTIRK